MKPFRALIVALASVFAAAAPALAAPSRAELDERLVMVEAILAEHQTRLEALERVLLSGDPAAVRLQTRLDSVEGELASITGALEQAQFENQALRQQIEAMRRELEFAGLIGIDAETSQPSVLMSGVPDGVEFDPRDGLGGAAPSDQGGAEPLSAAGADGAPLPENDPSFFGDDPFAEAKARATGQLGASAVTNVALPEQPGPALDLAKNLLMNGRFADAEQLLAEFATTFADAPELAEALFWRAETFFLRDAHGQAKDLYIQSLQADRNSPRAPDAMVRLALSLNALGFDGEACSTLGAFPTTYPNAGPAVNAKANRAREVAGCR